MPSALFAKLGIKQTVAYGLHMFMYGTPLLMFLDKYVLETLPAQFQKYVFNDWPFLTGLTLLVFLDTIAGGVAALVNKQFSGITFYRKLGAKTIGIAMYVLAVGIVKNTIINGEENLMADIVDSGFYSVMMGFELASVLKNTYKVYPFEFIKEALRRLEIFYDKKTNKVKDNEDQF